VVSASRPAWPNDVVGVRTVATNTGAAGLMAANTWYESAPGTASQVTLMRELEIAVATTLDGMPAVGVVAVTTGDSPEVPASLRASTAKPYSVPGSSATWMKAVLGATTVVT
jgi:hypothetical protein